MLVTDGWENHGDAERALGAIRSAGVRLYIFTPPGARGIPNVAITGLTMPPALAKSEPFALGVTATNYNSTPVGGNHLDFPKRPPDRRARRHSAKRPAAFRLSGPCRGVRADLVHRLVQARQPGAGRRTAEDDSLTGWVGIGAQRKVLILTGSARDAEYLESVVHRMGLEPTVVTPSGSWSGNLKGYDAVVLNNVPRSRLSPAAQQALVNYVEEGGSLAMAGGDESFGLGGYQDSPLARALPVIMKPPQHRQRTRALVLIIDKSGSMGRNEKLEYAKAAARTVTKTLADTDLVAVIGFDSQPFVMVPLTPLSQSRPYFDQLINRLKAHGTTYLLPAMQEAERMLAGNNASVKHVVVLTDGETGGTAAMYYDLVSTMHREGGVTISTIAIGREANLPLLESISKYGGGGFYQTDSASNLPELFLQDVKSHGGETTMVEKDFTPFTVKPDPLLKDLAGRQLPAIKGFVATELKPQATLDAFINRANTRTAAHRELALRGRQSGRGHHRRERAMVLAVGAGRNLRPGLEQGVLLDDARDRRHRTEVRRRARLPRRPHPSAGSPTIATGRRRRPRWSARPSRAPTAAACRARFPRKCRASFTAASTRRARARTTSRSRRPPPRRSPSRRSRTRSAPRSTPSCRARSPTTRCSSASPSGSGGRLNPSPADVGLTRPEHELRQSMAAWPLLAAMILLIGEALVRRLTF